MHLGALINASDYNPLTVAGVRVVTFVSGSKGRGRQRKKPEEVTLVGYRGRYTTWRDTPNNGLDRICSEIMEEWGTPPDQQWGVFSELIDRKLREP